MPTPPKKKVVVVMPAHNASATLNKTMAALPTHAFDEIILVDDGSFDDTSSIASKLPIHTIRHLHALGYGASQKTCFHMALQREADVIVLLHPDYRFDPGLIPNLALPILEGQADVVLASRFIRDPMAGGPLKSGMPVHRYLANRLLTTLQNFALGLYFSDYHTGYRAFSRTALERIPFERNSDGQVFDNEILLQLIEKKVRFHQIGVGSSFFPHEHPVNFWSSLVYGINVLRATLEFLFHRWGLKPSPKYQDRLKEDRPGRPCPVCGGNLLGWFFTDSRHDVKRCFLCGHVFISNPPDETALKNIYQDFYKPQTSERFHLSIEILVRWFRKKRAKEILAMMKDRPSPSILDIGCGRGWMLYHLQQRGWKCLGTQISKPAAEFARKTLGLHIEEEELPALRLPGDSIDLITAFHVMEHLKNPGEYAREAHRLLKPGGVFLVEVPNVHSWGSRFFNDAWYPFDLTHHLSYFSAPGFTAHLETLGFRTLKVKHFSMEYSIYTWLQSFLNLFFNDRDKFFNMLQTDHRPSLKELAFYGAAALFFLPISALCAVGTAAIRRGDVMRIICVKEGRDR